MKQIRLLYAEDFAPIAEIVSLGLVKAGHSVKHARNGQEALAEFLRAPADFDALLTDHDMPLMGGLELLKALRQNAFTGHALINSGSLGARVQSAYEELGPVRFIGKPMRVAELLQAIEQIPER